MTHKPRPPFLPLPCARSMVFCYGSRALAGQRGALLCALGEGQQPADLSCAPLPQSRSRVLQVMGDQQTLFFVMPRCCKCARGKQGARGVATREHSREPPEAYEMLFSSRGNLNTLNFPIGQPSVICFGWPPWAPPARKLGPWHDCVAFYARLQRNCKCKVCSDSPSGHV